LSLLLFHHLISGFLIRVYPRKSAANISVFSHHALA